MYIFSCAECGICSLEITAGQDILDCSNAACGRTHHFACVARWQASSRDAKRENPANALAHYLPGSVTWGCVSCTNALMIERRTVERFNSVEDGIMAVVQPRLAQQDALQARIQQLENENSLLEVCIYHYFYFFFRKRCFYVFKPQENNSLLHRSLNQERESRHGAIQHALREANADRERVIRREVDMAVTQTTREHDRAMHRAAQEARTERDKAIDLAVNEAVNSTTHDLMDARVALEQAENREKELAEKHSYAIMNLEVAKKELHKSNRKIRKLAEFLANDSSD